jgi:hypothetical protein
MEVKAIANAWRVVRAMTIVSSMLPHHFSVTAEPVDRLQTDGINQLKLPLRPSCFCITFTC